jgi:hypothetical protein
MQVCEIFIAGVFAVNLDSREFLGKPLLLKNNLPRSVGSDLALGLLSQDLSLSLALLFFFASSTWGGANIC